jgi:hypothetical protein
VRIERGIRLAINANHLLARRMGLSREDARLGDGGATFKFQDTAGGNMFLAEGFQQQPSGFVITNHAHWKYVHAEVGEIVDGIRSAAWDHSALAMFEDKHGSFTGDAGDLAEDEFVRNQVSQYGDADPGKLVNDAQQALVGRIFLRLLHFKVARENG